MVPDWEDIVDSGIRCRTGLPGYRLQADTASFAIVEKIPQTGTKNLTSGDFLKGFSEIQRRWPSHFFSFTGMHFYLFFCHLLSALNFFNVVFASLELGKEMDTGRQMEMEDMS